MSNSSHNLQPSFPVQSLQNALYASHLTELSIVQEQQPEEPPFCARILLTCKREIRQSCALLLRGWLIPIISFFLISLLHLMIQNGVYYLHERRAPLRDLGFEAFSAISSDRVSVALIFFLILSICFVIFVMTPCFVKIPKYRNYHCATIIGRFLTIMSIALFLQSLTSAVTILPSPDSHCQWNSNQYKQPQNLSEIFLTSHSPCGSLIFSTKTSFVWSFVTLVWHYLGLTRDQKKLKKLLHSLKAQGFQVKDLHIGTRALHIDEFRSQNCCGDRVLVYRQRDVDNQAIAYLWKQQNMNARVWIPWVIILLALIHSILLIAEREHYSVDVLIALYLTTFISSWVFQSFPDSIKLRRKHLIFRLQQAHTELQSTEY